ncbi:MAG: hypothetical protein AAGA10_06610 [Bacteroidota bacterium]
MQEFSTKERKREFDKIFKEKMVPLFENHGFARHTKSSKRIFKALGEGLSVFIFFEYKSFGYGFYDMSIVYFDEEIGDVYDDIYLVMAQAKCPVISGKNAEELNRSVEAWKMDMQTDIFPFIEAHTTHKAILNATHFYFSKGREEQCRELLMRKAT